MMMVREGWEMITITCNGVAYLKWQFAKASIGLERRMYCHES
jgi:hypothetical protein